LRLTAGNPPGLIPISDPLAIANLRARKMMSLGSRDIATGIDPKACPGCDPAGHRFTDKNIG
jgi:hypothetical protein